MNWEKIFLWQICKKNYDAVYLGIGVGVARQLDIPG